MAARPPGSQQATGAGRRDQDHRETRRAAARDAGGAGSGRPGDGRPRPARTGPGALRHRSRGPGTADPCGPGTGRWQGKGVTLNFEAAPIRAVVKTILGDLLHANYAVDPKVQGKVSLQTNRPVARKDLLPILETLLRSQSAILVRNGDFYRILPATAAADQVLPLSVDEPSRPGYQVLVVPLHFVAAKEMQRLLTPLLPKGNRLQIETRRNLLILTGMRSEIRRLLRLVHAFDLDWLRGMSLGLVPLHNTEAKTLVPELQGILKQQLPDTGNGLLRMSAIERINAVLVVSRQPRYLDLVRDWIRQLDRPDQTAGRHLYVYEVQNAKAEDLAKVLTDLFTGGTTSRAAPEAPRVAPNHRPITLASALERAGAAGTGKSRSRPKARAGGAPAKAGGPLSVDDMGEVRIIANPQNNTLVILATAQDYEKVRAALRKLDTIPLQVLIEASIVDVSLSDELTYGLEWFFTNHLGSGRSGKGTLDLSSGAGLSAVVPGFSYAVVDRASAVHAVLNTLAKKSRLNVISSPSLMVLDNQTATIRVGDQQPIQTSTASTDAAVLVQSIQYKDTGVFLEVTPRVNSSGMITMDIRQEVTDVGDIDSATGQRSFLRREIKSSVSVESGETIVLGGLIKRNRSRSHSGIPLLSDLPVVGNLFGQQSRSSDRTELIVLITPRAVRDPREARQVTGEFEQKLKILSESLK